MVPSITFHKIGVTTTEAGYPEFAESFARCGFGEYRDAYVACEGGRRVGFVCLESDPFNPSVMDIYEIFVLNDERRRGYGAAIIEKCVRLAEERDCSKLRVNPHNIDTTPKARLIEWYQRRGFTVEDGSRLIREL